MNQDKPWLVALYISGAGVMLAGYIVAGFYVGRMVLQYWEAPKYVLAIGSLVGLMLGVAHIFFLIKRFMGENND